jgi:hypothetical protein
VKNGQAEFRAAEIGRTCIVGAARELHAGRSRLPDERLARDLIPVIDFHRHAVGPKRGDDARHPLGRPQLVVARRDLVGQIRRVDVDVDGLGAHDRHGAIDQDIHELLRIRDRRHLAVNPQPHPASLVVGPRHRVGEDVVEPLERPAGEAS